MRNVVWLASYPKSGNTWLRLLIASLTSEGDSIDINAFEENLELASARESFDHLLMIDSSLLSHAEIDCLRPSLHRQMASESDGGGNVMGRGLVRFVKVHDAYGLTPDGEPLLAGAQGAKGAIVIVRDPRDVAPSLANHLRMPIDAAIEFMNSSDSAFSHATNRLPAQLRQRLLDWSGHVSSWLDQRDIPVHVVRYEDIKRDAAVALQAVMRFAGAPVASADAKRAASLVRFESLQEQEQKVGFSEWFDPSGKGRKFFRRGEAGAWCHELSPKQVARIESMHAPMMRRMGYDLAASPSHVE